MPFFLVCWEHRNRRRAHWATNPGAGTSTRVRFQLHASSLGYLYWADWSPASGAPWHSRAFGRTAQHCDLQRASHAARLWHQGYGSASVRSRSLINLVMLASAQLGNGGCPLRRSLVLGQPTRLQTSPIRKTTQLSLHLQVSLLRDSAGKRPRSRLPCVSL